MSCPPAALHDRLFEADDRCRAYCHASEANTGQPMTVDHTFPQAQGGETTFENLCFACRRCNEFRGSVVSAQDPLTGETVPLFHPRQQEWADPFRWGESGTQLIGLTAPTRSRSPQDTVSSVGSSLHKRHKLPVLNVRIVLGSSPIYLDITGLPMQLTRGSSSSTIDSTHVKDSVRDNTPRSAR